MGSLYNKVLLPNVDVITSIVDAKNNINYYNDYKSIERKGTIV